MSTEINKPKRRKPIITERRLKFGFGSLRRIPYANDIFNTETFWPQLIADLKKAQSHVIIHSGFLTERRLYILKDHLLKLVHQNTRVCVTIEEPDHLTTPRDQLTDDLVWKLDQFERVTNLLRSMNVHLNLVEKVHFKFIIIDDICIWEGSLNPMSHLNRKDHMRRFISSFEVKRVTELHELDLCVCCNTLFELFLLGSIESPNVLSVGAKQLAARITQSRKVLGLSQEMLAKQCGIDPSQLTRIEKASVDPRVSTLRKLLAHSELVQVVVPRFLLPAIAFMLQRLDVHPLLSSTESTCAATNSQPPRS